MWESAISDRIKIVTLSQEGVRRMRNCGLSTSAEDRAAVMSDLMTKMRRSGYGVKMRNMVLDCSLVGYYRMRKTEEEGGRKVNRPMSEGKIEREVQKVIGKTEWMNSKGKKESEKKEKEGETCGGRFRGRSSKGWKNQVGSKNVNGKKQTKMRG